MTEMVPRDAARAAADRHRQNLARLDPHLEVWKRARAGEPVLVHTLAGEPSYWLVPVEVEGRLVGFVRVNRKGESVAGGVLGRDLAAAPSVVTWITAEEAAERARATAGHRAEVSRPVYVHDGPPGREAWRVDVLEPDGSRRVLLVTPGGVAGPTGGGEAGE
jgi:hypothetical protein